MSAQDPSLWRALRLLVATSWRADRRRSLVSLALQLGAEMGDLAAVYATKLVVDAATAGRPADGVRSAVAVAACVAATHAARSRGASVVIALRERTQQTVDARLLELLSGLPGLEHHERPELLDRIELLRQERWALGNSVNALLSHVGVLAQVVVTAVLLARLHSVLLLLPLAALVPVLLARRIEQIGAKASEEGAESLRLTMRLDEIARDPAVAGEIRMHAFAPVLLDHHRRGHEAFFRARRSAAVPTAVLDVIGNAVLTLAQITAVAFVALRAVFVGGTAGDVLLIVGLVLRVGRQVGGLSYGVEWLLTSLRTVGRLAWLEDEARKAAAAAAPPRPVPVPARLERGIVLEEVGFTYPGTDAPVLRDVSLLLPAGAIVALVGENGAGKTTLVKLLCRFYEPTSGRITVDGADLSTFVVGEWRERLSGAFQDFARFDLVAQEVVGVGDLPRHRDPGAVRDALYRAGAERVMLSLPDGLDSLLGTSFDGGIELSAGQWQQLALGRAMMRRGPLLLGLDEPTAALDPGTEHALFERYAAEAGRVAAKTGAVTLLVSHRFSTVRMADLIVVMEHGAVTEVGDHASLMASGGLYAELYALQARAYRA